MTAEKKILYISIHPIDSKMDGISKKIRSQIAALKKASNSVDTAYLTKKEIKLFMQGEEKTIKINSLTKNLFYYTVSREIEKKRLQYDLIYIRNPQAGLICFGLPYLLRHHKKNQTKIVIEVPTYPYDSEMKSVRAKIALLPHRLIRKTFHNYVDLISYMGRPIDKIWNTDAIRLINGVNSDDPYIPRRQSISNKICFIGVADLNYWHGYDRLIKSIYNFVNDPGRKANLTKVEFHIIGDNEPTYGSLKDLTKKLNLTDFVFFHGRKGVNDLVHFYSSAHIGVDALARHRSGNTYNCSIKSKEYCLHNIPVIKSHEDYSIDNLEFCYNVPASEDIFDINEILDWYKKLNIPNDEIRSYALTNFTWQSQMNKIHASLWASPVSG